MHIVHIQCLLQVDGSILAGVFLTSSFCVVPESSYSSNTASGIATPGHTRACAHVKFAGARVKMKAKVKDQLLACAITSFMRT